MVSRENRLAISVKVKLRAPYSLAVLLQLHMDHLYQCTQEVHGFRAFFSPLCLRTFTVAIPSEKNLKCPQKNILEFHISAPKSSAFRAFQTWDFQTEGVQNLHITQQFKGRTQTLHPTAHSAIIYKSQKEGPNIDWVNKR